MAVACKRGLCGEHRAPLARRRAAARVYAFSRTGATREHDLDKHIEDDVATQVPFAHKAQCRGVRPRRCRSGFLGFFDERIDLVCEHRDLEE